MTEKEKALQEQQTTCAKPQKFECLLCLEQDSGALRMASGEVEHCQIVKGHAKRFEASTTKSKQEKLNPEIQLDDHCMRNRRKWKLKRLT